jgi:hypothetical protein
MTKWTILLCTVVLASIGCDKNTKQETKTDPSAPRVGIYDSRAIAVAFPGTAFCKQTMSDLESRQDKAKAAGDQTEIKKLESEAQSWDGMLHKQALSTAPVDNLMAYIAGQLPEIKKQAGVELIVSKWDTQALAKYESSQKKDVTVLLVEAFKPNADGKEMAIEIMKSDPLPLEEWND